MCTGTQVPWLLPFLVKFKIVYQSNAIDNVLYIRSIYGNSSKYYVRPIDFRVQIAISKRIAHNLNLYLGNINEIV
jgi:hypothetical protein